MLDAPVSGGPRGAKSGKLAIWVGGERAIFDNHKALLDAMGDQARYIGPIGAGSVAKLVHNCAGYAVQAALAEVFSLGVKAGVEPLALFEAVRQGAGGRRRTFDGLADQFLPGTYDPPSFALRLAHKDVSLATLLGRELKVPMRIAGLALEELTEAMNRGWADRDSRVAMVLQQERAGVEIKVDRARIQAALESDQAGKR
jgi:3-hydroxyisobutyrate dehydrogenase